MDFRNELTGKNFDDKLAFRGQVVKLLREIYPKLQIRVENEPELIFINDMRCGLTNLRSRFETTAKTTQDLRELVEHHFGGIISAMEQLETNFEKTWDEARDLVMPQLMRRDYTEEFGAVSRAFGRDILIGIVLDDEKCYRYVRADELPDWNIEKRELYQAAMQNLEEKSRGIPVNLIPPPNGFLAVTTGDGFDAARIVLPSFQALVREHFGSPFRFGVPNRDFLICWAADEPADFHKAICDNLANDANTRPYPLSGTAFEIDENGEITQVSQNRER